MRFKAVLIDYNCITEFSNIVSTLAKNVKTCVLRLSPDKLCFVISEKGPLSMNLWCELTQSNLFDEYRIDGKGDNNEIYLQLNIDQMSQILKLSHNAQQIKIKLTKKQGAFLSLEVSQPTGSGSTRNISHDIPVSIIPQRLWTEYQEPDMPDIDVSIYLPPLKQLKSLLEKMKTLADYVTISANMNGELQLKIETDIVSVTTFYQKLTNHSFDTSSSCCHDDVLYSVRIDIRKLCQAIGGHFNPSKVISNIVDRRGIQLFLLHEDMSLQYYIPAVSP